MVIQRECEYGRAELLAVMCKPKLSLLPAQEMEDGKGDVRCGKRKFLGITDRLCLTDNLVDCNKEQKERAPFLLHLAVNRTAHS